LSFLIKKDLRQTLLEHFRKEPEIKIIFTDQGEQKYVELRGQGGFMGGGGVGEGYFFVGL
jgi:hypothetical protein